MLVFDFHKIGNKLHASRKHAGMTQTEVVEAAELSDRTYADTKRGSVNMRFETILRICSVLHITPDYILTEEETAVEVRRYELLERLNRCRPRQREAALRIPELYLDSLGSGNS